MQIHKESSSKRVLWLGSKYVISVDESNEKPYFSGADCVVNDRAESEAIVFSPFDATYPGSLPGIAMSSTEGTTVGLLRSLEDPENANLDLAPLVNFHSEAYASHDQIIVLPDPLGLNGRQSIVNSFQTGEGLQLCHKQFIFSNTQALVLSFLQSKEGFQLFQTRMGSLKLIILQLGEDYCCASAVHVESIFPHDHALVNERIDSENEESFFDSNNENSFTKFTPKLEIDRLQINTIASEGHMGFGLQDVDELVLHDWLAVMYHLAKSMKVKRPDKSWRLSKEALEGHNHHQSKENHRSHHKVPEEQVNGVEGFKWWVKLSPYNRSRCLRAVSLFRCACNHDRNFPSMTQSIEQDFHIANLSFYNQLLDAGSFGERVKLLSDFLFNECDSILQSITGWVSIQGESILHQILEQYGNDIIKVEVKSQSSSKYLCIDSSKDFVANDDAMSQTDAASMVETIFYDIYCRPMIRPHLNQICKGLKRKLDSIGFHGTDSINSKIVIDSMLLWSEIATNSLFGEEHINNIAIKEASHHFNIRSIKCHRRKKTDLDEKIHDSADQEGAYSCGTKVTNHDISALQHIFNLNPTALLKGLRNLIDLVPHVGHHVLNTSNKPADHCNYFQNLSLNEVISTSSWCGNIGFALVKEFDDQMIGKIELSTNDIVWLTDLRHLKKRKRSNRRRLKDINNFVLELNLPKSTTITAENETTETYSNFPAYLTVYGCHPQTINVDSGELRGVLESVTACHPNSRSFFLENQGSSSLFGCNHEEEEYAHPPDELFQREFTLIHFQEDCDSYGNVNGVSPMCEQNPVRLTDSSNVDDSLLSSSTVHSGSQLVGDSSILHTSYLPPHEEQQLRNNHSFYQRLNRHRRGLFHKQQQHPHLYHHQYQHAHHRVPAHYSHSSHHHQQQQQQQQQKQQHLADSSIVSTSAVNHSHGEIHDSQLDRHVEYSDAPHRWRLLIVRSTGVYHTNAAQNALLMDSTDSNDDFQSRDNSAYHETLVHENIHILHSIPLDHEEGENANDHCYRYVSMNFNENGIFNVHMAAPMSEEEFLRMHPLPPLDEEEPLEVLDERMMKEQEIESIKYQVLSFIPSVLTDAGVGGESHSMNTTRVNKSERKLSKTSSRVATILFALLLLLSAAVSFTLVSGARSLFNTKLSTNVCQPPKMETNNDIYIAPFLESGTLDVHHILDDPDISNTDSELDEIHHLHLLHDDSYEINNQLLEEKSNKIKNSQIIFASKSHFARLRYVLHRLKGNIVESLGVVRNVMLKAFKRFGFGGGHDERSHV